MLDGIIAKPLKLFADERGFFTEIMRIDWKNLLDEDSIMQANLFITYPESLFSPQKFHYYRLSLSKIGKGFT